MMESMINQIEEQQNLMAEMVQELQEKANQQWQELTQKLNNENSLLLKQSRELLTLNSR